MLEPKMEDEEMKKLVVLIFMMLFLVSCGHSLMGSSEFMQHDTMYKNWDHMKFSWFGTDQATSQDLEKSIDQQWWGFEVPYVPGQ